MDTSDELLKACDIKAGQVIRIRKALKDQAVASNVNTIHDLTQCQGITFNVVESRASGEMAFADIAFADVSDIANEEVVSSPCPVAPEKKDQAQLVFCKEEKATDEKWLASFQLPNKVYMKTIKIQLV